MTLITSQIVFEKMVSIEKKLDALLDKEVEHSVEECSLFRATKLMKLGAPSVIRLVKLGHLKARSYKDLNRKTRYRFRIADIRAFQKDKQYDHLSLHNSGSACLVDGVETAEEIGKRVFNKQKEG